jgi:outer membrane protein assembly factor BamE (lipoprotein component of BamABCDE complex)
MFRPAVLAAAVIGLAAVAGGCTPLTSYSGFQAIEAKPADMKIGEDSKSTVTEKLGSPSATSTFDGNAWYYISQTTDRVAFYKPRVIKRDVVAIKFNAADEKVASVDTFTLKDGKVIAYNGHETPTRGREMTILEQLLGNVGRGGMLPNDDQDAPGNRPQDRR